MLGRRLGLILGALLATLVAEDGVSAAAKSVRPPDPAAACLKSLRPLARGAIPQSVDFVAVPCGAKRELSAFYYDWPSRATRIGKDLAAGAIVARFPEFGTDVIVPGQRVTLVVKIGAVRVEREVDALQEARAGQWLFVRDGSGHVFSTKFETAAP